ASHYVRSSRRKKFAADLKRADRGRHFPRQLQRHLCRGNIQRYNDRILHVWNIKRTLAKRKPKFAANRRRQKVALLPPIRFCTTRHDRNGVTRVWVGRLIDGAM